MDLQEYIASGILELYVAGALSEQESREVTALVQQHPELQEAVEQIEAAYIQLSEYAAPYGNVPPLSLTSDSKPEETPIVSIRPWQRYAMAAMVILLLASILLNYRQYLQLQDSNDQILALESERQKLAGDIDVLNANYETNQTRLADLRDPQTQTIALAGTDKAPNKSVQVYWNRSNDRVFVDLSQLPPPPEGQVYQLWSLTSLDPLTPVDAGVLTGYGDGDLLFNGKPTNEAVAFAITLEPAGGSASPTLEELYVLGTI
ncbi:MAG: anti-sigma factor [Bacteroidota bacterium]